MKKRVFCNLLVLVLLLGMLPTAAMAGGGSSVVWSEDFSEEDTWAAWTAIDANNDGYGFIRGFSIKADPCETLYYAASPSGIGETEGVGASSDEYLVSPVINLENAWDEFELSFDFRCMRPESDNTPAFTRFELYVIDADTPLTARSMRNLPNRRFAFEAPHADRNWITGRYDLTAYAGRQIRLVIHHEDESANQLHLDNFQILDCETDQHVERITVLNVLEPRIGLGVPDADESDIVVVDSTNLSYVPGSLMYRRTVNESGVPFTGDFEEGAEYSIEFQLRAKEGCFTYADAIASVNGHNAISTLNDNGTPEDSSDDIITIYYYFGYLHAQKQCIEGGTVSLIPPVVGKMPSYYAEPVQDNFSVTSIYWCELNDDNTAGPAMAPTDHYESGKTYRCCFEVAPNDGYYFAEYFSILVNGENRHLDHADAEDRFWFCADFETAESDDCTVGFFAGYGESPAPYSGRIGDKITLPVLADQPDHVFAGWGYQPWSGINDTVSSDFHVTRSCTLYAVWLEVIQAPEVRISAPDVSQSVHDAKVVVEKYDTSDYDCDPIAPGEDIAWWLDPGKVGEISQRYPYTFAEGQTYYGMAYLQADGNHCFAADASGLKLSGAVLDEAVAEGRRMTIKFHLTMPGGQTVDKAELFVDTLVSGYPVDENFKIPVYSLTPGLIADVRPGVYQSTDDAYLCTNAYVGGMHPGQTYYGAAVLSSSAGAAIDPELKVTITGARQTGKSVIDEYTYLILFAVEDKDAYDVEIRVASTDGSERCGYFCSDLHSSWTDFMEGPFTPAGEHWLKAAPESGYVFLGWRAKEGGMISTDDFYSFTLNADLHADAVFAPGFTVSFLNAHGDNPPTQTVVTGGCAVEPAGMTAEEYTFRGWFTDPECKHPYDFATPVTSNLILYSGWDYTPGVDKSVLDKAISDAEAMDTSKYTVESVTTLAMVLTGARMVQSAAGATQADVDAAVENIKQAVAGLEPKEDTFFFDDVRDPGKFYFAPVYWAYEHTPQITNGVDDTHFGPDNPCTRGHVVTFLWRAAGCPEPASTETPFKDLKKGAFYEKAVAWAVEQGITNGLSDDKFGPDAQCNRGQIVTFLWRYKGQPAPANEQTPFKDLKAGAFYLKAVAWAVESEVTNGVSKDKFGPDATCTRGQVVTFLYRAAKD